jgi:hypothetical protein
MQAMARPITLLPDLRKLHTVAHHPLGGGSLGGRGTDQRHNAPAKYTVPRPLQAP